MDSLREWKYTAIYKSSRPRGQSQDWNIENERPKSQKVNRQNVDYWGLSSFTSFEMAPELGVSYDHRAYFMTRDRLFNNSYSD